MQNVIRPTFGFLFAAASFMLVVGCQSSSDQSTSSAAQSDVAAPGDQDGDLRVVASLPPPDSFVSGSGSLLAENDLLEIDVFDVDNLDKQVRVNARGEISMPLIGTINVVGLTVPELEQKLEQAYGTNYIQSPDISVFVVESTAQGITIDGEFGKTGFLPATSQSTLLKTVAQSGGLSQLADPNKIYVFRTYKDGKRVANYSIAQIREGKKADPRIYGGDVIVAFPSQARVAARNLREALGLASSVAGVAAI